METLLYCTSTERQDLQATCDSSVRRGDKTHQHDSIHVFFPKQRTATYGVDGVGSVGALKARRTRRLRDPQEVMTGGPPKPAIPAWQRAQPNRPSPQEESVSSQPEPEEPEQTAPESDSKESAIATEGSTAAHTTAPNDPVQQAALSTDDFENFKQQITPRPSDDTVDHRKPPPSAQRSGGPPIITYPEFLVEAHKPPPLITPTRVLNSLYAAGGLAALIFGTSKWIVDPMLDSMTLARHEFATHSRSKVDEFNERLAQIVSTVPEPKKSTLEAGESDTDEAESEASDPTELFHRDMGTQTSPEPSRRTSISNDDVVNKTNNKDVNHQTNGLSILNDHLKELVEGVERTGESNKERQESLDKLRHYLDSLLYASSGINVWTSSEDSPASKTGDSSSGDAIEELKKEIRGVKGVMLSAKRFPSVNRYTAGSA